MKIQVTLLSLVKTTSSRGNDYGQAQVIFHDQDGDTAGPCNIFGDLFESIKDAFKPYSKFNATIQLQPDMRGTQVFIRELLPIPAQKPATV